MKYKAIRVEYYDCLCICLY